MTQDEVWVELTGCSRRLHAWVISWDDPHLIDPGQHVKVRLDDGNDRAIVWVPFSKVFAAGDDEDPDDDIYDTVAEARGQK